MAKRKMQTLKLPEDMIIDLKKESKAFHNGNFNGYVVYLLENHPTRSVNLSIAKYKAKKNPIKP